MAAPKKNQFWKNRTTHGRDLLFSTGEILWEECSKYFNWCDANPWWRNEPIKGGSNAGKIIKVSNARPYSLSGLCSYLDVSENYWHSFKKNKKLSEDILLIIARVERIIDTQQFEGAAVGAFRENIIARKLGLIEKQEITGKDGGPI